MGKPLDESFTDFIKEKHKTFLEKILQYKNLLNIIQQKNINVLSKLNEYFVCSKTIKNYSEIAKKFDLIKKDIRSSRLMFKDVIISHILEKSRESAKNKGFYIVKKFRAIIWIDFDNSKSTIEEVIEEKEVSKKDCTVINTEEVSEFKENDEVRWYDIVSLGIAKLIRDTKRYNIYKIHIYQVGDKQIKGEKIWDGVEYI